MSREQQILTILYEMAMAIGGEVSVKPLLTKTLQHLLYHTSFPAGLVFLDLPPDTGSATVEARLEVVIGDFELGESTGHTLTLPAALLRGGTELREDPALLASLSRKGNAYSVFLRLPIDHNGVILLLAPKVLYTELPLTSIFQPVMASLAKAILLCRHHEAYTAELQEANQKQGQINEELEIKVQERTKQLREAQEELVRKEKLAVLGQVAGSVGHELRNPLGVINNAVYFLQTVLSDADEITREYLNIIKEEVAGSERIVSDLLDSVRTKPPQVQTVGVAELLEQTLRKCSVPSSVTVKLEIPATLSPLRVDAMQIQQVLRNLISNGVEAMPEGGILGIQAVENRQDGTITVSVRDSGSGIAPEVLSKLFQPLFTTKARGIGLGLVVVKNLTQANGGSVKVESEVGKGSVFSVTLPAGEEGGK